MTDREHKPYYERRIDQQTLDALLRIEEILARAFPEPQKEEAPAEDDAEGRSPINASRVKAKRK